MDVSAVWMFIMQAILAGLMLLLGIVLKGVQANMGALGTDLKSLNNAVLQNYLQRAELESVKRDLWEALDKQTERLQVARMEIEVLKKSAGR